MMPLFPYYNDDGGLLLFFKYSQCCLMFFLVSKILIQYPVSIQFSLVQFSHSVVSDSL